MVALAVALGSLPAPAPAAAAPAADEPSRAAGGNAVASEATLDPVVQEVLRMLRAKVSEPVIVHCLATSGRRPAAIGSREIVELQRANASDPLMTRLLDLAARQATSEPSAGAAAASSGPSASSPAAASSAASASTAAAAPGQAPPTASAALSSADTAAAPAPPSHAASFHWRIAYHPNFGADDERWDLYVYLDGRYLAAVKSPTVSFVDPPVELDRSLPPGHHVLRVAMERHLRKLGRSGWTHEARVAPAALAFEIAPDSAGTVELRCETRLRGGPLTLRVTQGDAELVRSEPAIAQPEAWPWLCEEVTAGKPAGKRPRFSSARGDLSSCLRWADLWPGMEAPPSRDAVRADLERRGFRSDR